MKVYDVEQNTLAWLNLHIGIPTAAGLDNLLTPEFEQRTGEMPRTFVYKKLAESWRGKPLVNLGTFSVEQGMILEEEALPFFTLETGKQVERVGFITTDDGKFGCSPDGVVGETGLEIKCPEAWTHTKYLLNGVLPKEYAPQVHGGLYATGFKSWTFMSYRRGFPPLILKVERDETIIAKIAKAVERFHADFNFAKDKMTKMRV